MTRPDRYVAWDGKRGGAGGALQTRRCHKTLVLIVESRQHNGMESAAPTDTSESREPAMSLIGRLVNVFVSPGEVFQAVAARPFSVANYLVPALIGAVVGAISVVFLFSQPAIEQQLRDAQ